MLVDQAREEHVTPDAVVQPFTWAAFRRQLDPASSSTAARPARADIVVPVRRDQVKRWHDAYGQPDGAAADK